MKIDVFHPALDMYGGAEFVAVVIANTLAENGYEVELFVNKQVDLRKTEEILGERIFSSVKIVVNPTFLQPRGILDLYQNMFRSLKCKSNCDLLIDTYSNCIFPWTDVIYIHYPFLNKEYLSPKFPYLKSTHLREILGLPYVFFSKNIQKYNGKLLLTNSHFTSKAIKDFSRLNAEVLYPPVPSTFFSINSKNLKRSRNNLVVTVSRFATDKGLEKIPLIAKLTNNSINFAIIGLLQDKNIVRSLLKSIKNLGLNKRIKIFTDIPKKDMKKILSNSKLYLHTTVGEHFGISIIEAMAMGCIPIVHNSGGVKEFVPAQYRYENTYDAVNKIEKGVFEWSPSKAKEVVRIAENFTRENFSRKFMKIFQMYENNLERL